jgi:hypothetical protein
MVVTGDGEAVQLASAVDIGKIRCNSSEDEGIKGGGNLQRSFGMVDSARAVAHRRGGKLHTAARVLTCRIKIHHRMGTIYRVFFIES